MAVVLILAYVLYLFFELGTHKSVFEEESPKVARRMRRHELPEGAIRKGLAKAGGIGAGIGRPQLEEHLPDDELLREHLRLDDYEDECEPQLHIATVFAVLVLGTTILAFNTQFMIDSIQGLTERANVPRDFIGMVLLPILSNDAMAIQCAGKDQMDLVIQSALGKSIQTALVVAPILVLIGWFIGIDDMNLLFDGFQVVALFVSVLLAQHCILDGKSNW
jgi:Ca2+:H+ antiporter